MWLRVVLDILLFLSLILLPWWLTTLIVVALLFYFPKFYEAIFAGFFMDAVFATSTSTLADFQFFFTTLYILLFIIFEVLKPHIRFEPR